MGPINGGPINLTGARLNEAGLRFATLSDADLEAACASNADFTHARLDRANLSGADLTNAALDHADFAGANLRRANLSGASLLHARNLTQEQVDASLGSNATVLPPNLARPARWPTAQTAETRNRAPIEKKAAEHSTEPARQAPQDFRNDKRPLAAAMSIGAVLILGGIGWFYAESNSPSQTREEGTQIGAPSKPASPPEELGSRESARVEPSAVPPAKEIETEAEPAPSREAIAPEVRDPETQTSAIDPGPDEQPEPPSPPEIERRHGTTPDLTARPGHGSESRQGLAAPEEPKAESSSAAPASDAREEAASTGGAPIPPIEDGQAAPVEPSATPDAPSDVSALSPPAIASLPQATAPDEIEASLHAEDIPPLPLRKPSLNASRPTPEPSRRQGQYSQGSRSKADNRARSLTQKDAQEIVRRVVSDLLAGGL